MQFQKKLSFSLLSVLILLLVFTFSSCGNNSLYENHKEFSTGFWQQDKPQSFEVEINDSQKQELKNVSKKIIELKGYTQYGPAYCIAKTINAILNNTKEIIPCSCVLEGEYGLRDIALGVPAVLTSEGVKIKELKLEKEHIEELKKTADKLQKFKNL